MCIGDSITAGSPSATFDSYRARLRIISNSTITFVGNQTGSGSGGVYHDPQHEGYPGKRIDQVEPLVTGSVTTHQPDIVLMMLGTNDIIQDHVFSGSVDRLLNLASKITASLAAWGGQLFIGCCIPMSASSPENARRVEFNQKLAASGSAFNIVLSLSSSLSHPSDFIDEYHPTQSGYDEMATDWWTMISGSV